MLNIASNVYSKKKVEIAKYISLIKEKHPVIQRNNGKCAFKAR